jgi:amicyanin
MKKGVVIGIVGVILLIAVGVYFYLTVSPVSNETIQNLTEQNIILIQNFQYTPQDLTIKVGETVTWTNKDSMKHTVTSDDGSELNSTYIDTDTSYAHTFNQIGEYPYHCIPHPFMTGKIIVEA